MHRTNLHQILQYSLLCARQADDRWEWDLGPIHLIKYAYLADILYAQGHKGETFTGVDWKFHNFGPWALEVYNEIPIALNMIGADLDKIESSYGEDDFHRWSYQDEDYESQFDAIGKDVPLSIAIPLMNLIKKYGKNTPDLLDFVYNTKPMKFAAPEESLNFDILVKTEPSDFDDQPFIPATERLSAKKKKKLKARIKELKAAKREAKQDKPLIPSKMPPIEEGIWQEGMDWLDGLAGPPVPKGKHTVEFDSTVWKTSVRRMEEY